jgi:flagellar hook protein FlgE
MSLTNALNSATSGLLAQAKALASISSNIANSSTTGYKSTSTTFESFLNKKNTVDEDTGGVRAYNYRNISAQGDIQSTSVSSNLAVDGDGFFVVSDDSSNGEAVFTRNGSFKADDDGYLANSEGYYLYGWELDTNGKIKASNKGSTDSLTAVNIADIKGTPKATTSTSIAANLPSDADVGDSFTSDMEVFDSLGNSQSITLTWKKTANNEWSLDAADPAKSSDSSVVTGDISGFPVSITFDDNGTLTKPTSVPSFGVDWNNGAADSTISLNLGTAGATDGLTQHASEDDEDPKITVDSTDQNGYGPGSLSGTTIDENGIVNAVFSNGESRAIFQIPIATFANADGLNSISGSVFSQTTDSGVYQLRAATEGGAGKIKASALEGSTVEMTDEFSRMIMTQQAYTAASKVVTTADEMLDTLIQTKR